MENKFNSGEVVVSVKSKKRWFRLRGITRKRDIQLPVLILMMVDYIKRNKKPVKRISCI